MRNNLTIIDVRTPAEYKEGNAEGSINIPLNEISARIIEIGQLPQPLVLCCASGNRSGQAFTYLQGQGIDCINGGSWINVKNTFSKN